MKQTGSVELRAAKIPGIVGIIADHYWFVIEKDEQEQQKSRWEIWQDKNVSAPSWQHLHKDLKPYNDGVGNGVSRVEHRWDGNEAARLIRVLEQSPTLYPHTDLYRYWPGPNSNTYIQWILDQAHINMTPGPSAIGKDYLGLLAVKKLPQGGVLSTPVGTLAFARGKYIIIELLALPFGVFFKPFRLVYPGLRLGHRPTRKE